MRHFHLDLLRCRDGLGGVLPCAVLAPIAHAKAKEAKEAKEAK